MLRMKNKSVPVGSISINANRESAATEITEPIIWIKLIRNASKPQKIGKLTSNAIQAKLNPTPVKRLIMNLTLQLFH